MVLLQKTIKVILVEPSGPLNVGSVARLCENFGINELRLVEPRCNPRDQDALRMAVKGKGILLKAKQYSCLLDAISDCRRVVATSGRCDHGEIPLCTAQAAMQWIAKASSSSPIALVFGREDRGLTNQELLLAQKVLTINTMSHYQSLNLSHAVGIVLHELHQNEQKLVSNNSHEPHNIDPASPLKLNNCLIDLEELLLDVGFLYKHTSQARMSKIKAFLQRSEVRAHEVSFIRGMLRQIRWAMKNNNY